MADQPHQRTKPSREVLIRSVASSTAIESGEDIAAIEQRLKSGKRQFPHIGLAQPPTKAQAEPAPK
ncbi:hypothetical protein [Balneatrix alpica]|uniref:Uncharacterized protein n=1 Tax=Balneatrix alpica TaxID=75684 RepID=A0ABV5ZDE8_9GAMM|nr:hypothetical protein [Balneatrix alpica]